MSDSRIDEEEAQLRNLALPWQAAHGAAMHSAALTIHEMRANFMAYADEDPYDTGNAETATPLQPIETDDPTVQAMAEVFIGILNRRGLIRIDRA
jgi:hypothetical protein